VPEKHDLLVVGSVALDQRDGPFGNVEEELGGSAVYFALAASLIVPVKVSAPVGLDGIDKISTAFGKRPIDTALLEPVDAPTYRWSAHQEHGRNVDLGNSDRIYDSWEPKVPPDFAGWAFVGSMRPDRQAQSMKMLGTARILAADAMLSYVKQQTPEAKDVLRRSSWFFCNAEEFTALGGGDPDQFRRTWWLEGLVVKAGSDGVTVHTPDGKVHVPALSSHEAVDTTGAGDALAGGMLARWLCSGGQLNGLLDALVYGVGCASLTIEGIGARSIASATREQLEERVAEVWDCLKRES
jgi:cytidine kinase